jgi:hypothetical protein
MRRLICKQKDIIIAYKPGKYIISQISVGNNLELRIRPCSASLATMATVAETYLPATKRSSNWGACYKLTKCAVPRSAVDRGELRSSRAAKPPLCPAVQRQHTGTLNAPQQRLGAWHLPAVPPWKWASISHSGPLLSRS